MTHPNEASFSFTYPTPQQAAIIAASLRQELGEIDDDRSQASLTHQAASLELTIHAADLIALRAAINTWLTLVSVADRVSESGDF